MDWVLPVVPLWPEATTFELLPERIDLVSLVLQFAGLGALVGTAIATKRRHARPTPTGPALAERFSVGGAVLALALFIVVIVGRLD